MKAKRLSANILKNTVQNWARFCAKHPDFNWTKHDSNAMFLITEAIKEEYHERYLSYREQKLKPKKNDKTEKTRTE